MMMRRGADPNAREGAMRPRKLYSYVVEHDNQPIHADPEFETFTYGDPTPPKASLSRLSEGSLLVFYAGLKGFDFGCPPALYIVGYFEIARAGRTSSYSQTELVAMFRNNFHVIHAEVFEDQKHRLVLVKGTENSRLLTKAVRLSSLGTDRSGRPLQRLSPETQQVFGDFGGNTGIQRSPPRWVAPQCVEGAAIFVKSLR
jgi:putative DNA base modification enzyme with NMAD domain